MSPRILVLGSGAPGTPGTPPSSGPRAAAASTSSSNSGSSGGPNPAVSGMENQQPSHSLGNISTSHSQPIYVPGKYSVSNIKFITAIF